MENIIYTYYGHVDGLSKGTFYKTTQPYTFTASAHPQRSNLYKLIADNECFKKRITGDHPEEMAFMNNFKFVELDLNGLIKTGRPIAEDYDFLPPHLHFYHQQGNKLFGEDLETGNAMFAELIGPLDDHGVCIPELVNFQVSKIKFNKVNLFNCPAIGNSSDWAAALTFKHDALGNGILYNKVSQYTNNVI